MTHATDSQIAMWRGAIALAHANAEMTAGDKAQLLSWFRDNIYLSDSQRAQLTTDLDKKIQLDDVWGQITDIQDRAYLLDIAPALFSRDGNPTPEEKILYDKMFAEQMASVDQKALQKEILAIKTNMPAEAAADEKIYLDEMDKEGSIFSTIGHLVYHFEKMLGIESI